MGQPIMGGGGGVDTGVFTKEGLVLEKIKKKSQREGG